MANYEGTDGNWIMYDYDSGPYIINTYKTADEAARATARAAYGKVGFWPFGMDFHEAINWWESEGNKV